MFHLLLMVGCVGQTLAGKSPNPDAVDQFLMKHPSARYSDDILEDAKLDVPGLVAKYGYPIESHDVVTQDGYGLTMHRIPHGRDSNNRPEPNKPIVFLMHGLMSSSADYVLLGPGNSLGYILAERGYDVWLGNARGNYYSRRHRRLNPNNRVTQNFWKFSWDEIGNYDLPACLDFIKNHTGQSRLHYIGHSQGGTAFLVLASLKPEYNKRFISFQGLAPAAFFMNNDNPTFTLLAPFENVLEPAAFAAGFGEIFGSNWCADAERSRIGSICSMVESNSTNVNNTIRPIIVGHTPAGGSVRQVAHYGQCIKFKSFRRYNHNNALTNIANYRRVTPPKYNLSKITTPSYIHYATNDVLVDPKDVQILASRLPNLKGLYLVDSPTFEHLDFIWASRAYELVYSKVLTCMEKAENY